MRRIGRIVLIALSLVVLGSDPLLACLNCKKSPNGWGFCRYYAYAGGDACEGYVVDEFSGRTWCYLYGYCNWNDTGASAKDPDCWNEPDIEGALLY